MSKERNGWAVSGHGGKLHCYEYHDHSLGWDALCERSHRHFRPRFQSAAGIPVEMFCRVCSRRAPSELLAEQEAERLYELVLSQPREVFDSEGSPQIFETVSPQTESAQTRRGVPDA